MAEPTRIRAAVQGDKVVVRVLMTHEMESGQRKDADGKVIPAHHIREVSVGHNGRPVLTAQWGPAVSKTLRGTVQRQRLQTIKRLIAAEVTRKEIVILDIASHGMHAKEAGFRSLRLNRNERRPTPRTTLLVQNLCQLFNGFTAKEGRDG